MRSATVAAVLACQMLLIASATATFDMAHEPGIGGPVLPDAWLQVGRTFTYQVSAPGITPFEFEIVIDAFSASQITFDMVIEADGSTHVRQHSYHRTTRADPVNPGVYSPLFVVQADIDAGQARLAASDFLLVADPLYHKFADAIATYTFDRAGGYLVKIENAETGTIIELTGQRIQADLPLPTAGGGGVVVQSEEPAGSGEPSSPTERNLRLRCPGRDYHAPTEIIRRPEGAYGHTCVSRFDVDSIENMKYGKYALKWPDFGVGVVTAIYTDADSDTHGHIRIYECTGAGPIVHERQVRCEEEYPRGLANDYHAVENRIEVQGKWYFCGNVTAAWACDYEWSVPVSGQLWCVSEAPFCVEE